MPCAGISDVGLSRLHKRLQLFDSVWVMTRVCLLDCDTGHNVGGWISRLFEQGDDGRVRKGVEFCRRHKVGIHDEDIVRLRGDNANISELVNRVTGVGAEGVVWFDEGESDRGVNICLSSSREVCFERGSILGIWQVSREMGIEQ